MRLFLKNVTKKRRQNSLIMHRSHEICKMYMIIMVRGEKPKQKLEKLSHASLIMHELYQLCMYLNSYGQCQKIKRLKSSKNFVQKCLLYSIYLQVLRYICDVTEFFAFFV